METVKETKEFITKDSGTRREYPTGSRRDSREGKGRFDLIAPFSLKRLADVYERGAAKYGENNWEKGQPIMNYLDSAVRHINDHLRGPESALEATEDHLAAAAWNLFSAMQTEELIHRNILPKDLDDRPRYLRKIQKRTFESSREDFNLDWATDLIGIIPKPTRGQCDSGDCNCACGT